MKKLYFCTLLSLVILNSACRKDEPASAFVGEWKIISESTRYAKPGEQPVSYEQPVDVRVQLKIMKDGVLEIYEPTPAPAPSTHAWITGTYSIEGNKITFNLPNYPHTGIPIVNTFTFSDNNTHLQLAFNEPGITYNGVPVSYIVTRNYSKED